jgi:uncharacterized protein (TIGR02466 family)
MAGPFAKVTPVPVLPTFVWVHELPPERAIVLNAQILGALEDLLGPLPRVQGFRTVQTEQTLHRYAALAPLLELIEAAVANVLERMAVETRTFAITGCWANFSQPGSAHLPHHHANNFLSGVYYVQAPGGADRITFHDPRPQREIIEPVYTRPNPFNRMDQDVPVSPGTIVIFPGWITHSVKPNRSEGQRLSIAFNAMFEDFAETVAKPRWTGIPFKRPPDA